MKGKDRLKKTPVPVEQLVLDAEIVPAWESAVELLIPDKAVPEQTMGTLTLQQQSL